MQQLQGGLHTYSGWAQNLPDTVILRLQELLARGTCRKQLFLTWGRTIQKPYVSRTFSSHSGFQMAWK